MAYGTGAYGITPWGSATGTEASAGLSQVQPVATWADIRTQMVSTIRGLTPVVLSAEPFRVTQQETGDFRSYANGNDQSVFREFSVEDLDHAALNAQDLSTQYRETGCEIVVAYPNAWGLYATADENNRVNEASLRAVIEHDANSILVAVGARGSANYVSGQHAALEETWSTETGEGVTFLVMPLIVTYYYDAS